VKGESQRPGGIGRCDRVALSPSPRPCLSGRMVGTSGWPRTYDAGSGSRSAALWQPSDLRRSRGHRDRRRFCVGLRRWSARIGLSLTPMDHDRDRSPSTRREPGWPSAVNNERGSSGNRVARRRGDRRAVYATSTRQDGGRLDLSVNAGLFVTGLTQRDLGRRACRSRRRMLGRLKYNI